MASTDLSWLRSGRGLVPRKSWAFATEAPLAGLALARETGAVLAADAAGSLYRLDRTGRLMSMTRGFGEIAALAWSDTGAGGAALFGENTLSILDETLEARWTLELPCPALAVAVDPRNRFFAVSLANLHTVVYDEDRRKLARLETPRPLRFLEFAAARPRLLAAAEYGLLAAWELDGRELFSRRHFGSTGDMAVTGDAGTIFLAGFTQGVQSFNGDGSEAAGYVMEGTPHRLAASFEADRLAVATLERHLYWLDAEGELLWAAETPEDVAAVCCEPLGNGLICGFASGRMVRLGW